MPMLLDCLGEKTIGLKSTKIFCYTSTSDHVDALYEDFFLHRCILALRKINLPYPDINSICPFLTVHQTQSPSLSLSNLLFVSCILVSEAAVHLLSYFLTSSHRLLLSSFEYIWQIFAYFYYSVHFYHHHYHFSNVADIGWFGAESCMVMRKLHTRTCVHFGYYCGVRYS